MALSKDKKHEVVDEVRELLSSSKLTVAATYQGTGVKQFQELRKQARDNETTIKVVKNRLVKKAIEGNSNFKNTDTSALTGQLLYAFNSQDEVAPAQVLTKFAKQYKTLEFVGGFTNEGQFISAEDITTLGNLPSKDQLRAQLVGTIGAPLSGFANVLAGNVRGVFNVLNARAESIK